MLIRRRRMAGQVRTWLGKKVRSSTAEGVVDAGKGREGLGAKGKGRLWFGVGSFIILEF